MASIASTSAGISHRRWPSHTPNRTSHTRCSFFQPSSLFCGKSIVFNSRVAVGFSSVLTCAAIQSQNSGAVVSDDDEGNLE